MEEITKFESLATREGMRGKLTIWKSQIEKEIEQIRMRETQQQKNMETEQAVTPKPKIHTKKITTYGIYVRSRSGIEANYVICSTS